MPAETEAQTKARFLKKYQTSKQLFEADLAPGGNAAVAGSLTNLRLTSNGLPFNFSSAMVRRWTLDIGNRRPDEEIIARAQELQAKNKGHDHAQRPSGSAWKTRILTSLHLASKRAAAGLA